MSEHQKRASDSILDSCNCAMWVLESILGPLQEHVFLTAEPSLQPIYLNAWSPVSGTVWEGLGGVVLLEDVLSLGADYEVSKAQAIPSSLSLTMYVYQNVRKLVAIAPAPCLPVTMYPVMMVIESPSETVIPN